jgi:hypothetical protein
MMSKLDETDRMLISSGAGNKADKITKAGVVLDEMSKIAKQEQTTIKILPSTAKDAAIIQSKQIFNNDSNKKKEMENYWDSVEIKCKVAEEKSIYISAEGIVQPCCWTAGQMYVWYWEPLGGQIWQAIDKVGKDALNAKNFNLEDLQFTVFVI